MNALLDLPVSLVHQIESGDEIQVTLTEDGLVCISSALSKWTAQLASSATQATIVGEGIVTHVTSSFSRTDTVPTPTHDFKTPTSVDVKIALQRLLYAEGYNGLLIEEIHEHLTSKYPRAEILTAIRDLCVRRDQKVILREFSHRTANIAPVKTNLG